MGFMALHPELDTTAPLSSLLWHLIFWAFTSNRTVLPDGHGSATFKAMLSALGLLQDVMMARQDSGTLSRFKQVRLPHHCLRRLHLAHHRLRPRHRLGAKVGRRRRLGRGSARQHLRLHPIARLRKGTGLLQRVDGAQVVLPGARRWRLLG